MKDKMIDVIFNHIADFANRGGDAQKAAIFRAGFYTLRFEDEHTPDGKIRISAKAQGYLADMPEELQAELKKGESWTSSEGVVFFSCSQEIDGVKIRITGVAKFAMEVE
jgi:hypothetical protein